MNGPKIHEYLQEMNQQVLSKYDLITVGEMPGINVEQAKLYTGEGRNELNMVFQFEHVDLDSGPTGKWDLKELQLSDLKASFTKWQKGLEQVGWNSLYLNNHDQHEWFRGSEMMMNIGWNLQKCLPLFSIFYRVHHIFIKGKN